MLYSDIRCTIKSGDLLTWTHRGWRSWYNIKVQLVRIVTRSEFSHVGIAWVVGGRVFVIESVTPVIRIVPVSTSLPCYWTPMDASWTSEVEEFALSLVGKGAYSNIEAIRAGFGQDTPESNEKWQCAKFVIAVYSRMGITISGNATPTNVVDEVLNAGRPVWKIQK